MTNQDNNYVTYDKRMAKIQKQLDTIERQLKVHSDSLKTWAEVGDLGHVSEQLQEVIDFLPTVQK